MAKEYGTPIATSKAVKDIIDEIADHLNWSKGKVVGYCVSHCKDELMGHPRAIRFDEAS